MLPVEAGKFEEFEFESGGAHFRVVVDAKRWDKRFLEEALREITGYELQLMGGPPFDPPDRAYTFIFHMGNFSEVGGGGMEHANSTAISGASTETVTPIAAHEFFHVWNVKRIRPQALDPVDYAHAQYTRALWLPAEGVTNTYSAFTLERTRPLAEVIRFMRTSFSKSATCNRAPPARGRARRIPAWKLGLKNTTSTTRRTAAFPTTARVRFSESCSIWPSAMPPTITSRSTTSPAPDER